jgi:hypothetical protein
MRRHEAERETYRRFAEPLTDAASALFWRLREIFETPGGGYYLERGGGESLFESYKASSTRFRIAALLGGWPHSSASYSCRMLRQIPRNSKRAAAVAR